MKHVKRGQLSGMPPGDFWDKASIDFTINVLITVLVLLALAVWLSTKALQVILHHRKQRFYYLEPFEDHSGLSGVSAVVRSHIQGELWQARAKARTLRRIHGAGAKLPDPMELLPEKLRWLEFLVRQLRRPGLLVHVVVLPNESNGPALDVQLKDLDQNLLEARRFHRICVPPTQKQVYSEVAIDAGVWLTYMISKHAKGTPLGLLDRDVSLFGTTSWESYALMRHAEQECIDSTRKRDWLNAALWEDHTNLGALIEMLRLEKGDLKALKARPRGVSNAEIAEEILRNLDDDSWQPTSFHPPGDSDWRKKGVRTNTMWYQSAYVLTVYYVNRYYALKNSDEGVALDQLLRSLRIGFHLTRAVGATCLYLEHLQAHHPRKGREYRELKQVLNRDGLDIATVVASARATLDCTIRGAVRAGILNDMQRQSIDAASRWKSASMVEIWEFLSGLQIGDIADIKSRLANGESLGDSWLSDVPSAYDLLTMQDRSVELHDHSKLFSGRGKELRLTPEVFMSWRLKYQRACVLSQLGQFDKAALLLEEVLDHVTSIEPIAEGYLPASTLRSWAMQDPALDDFWDYVFTVVGSPGRVEFLRNSQTWEYLRRQKRVHWMSLPDR